MEIKSTVYEEDLPELLAGHGKDVAEAAFYALSHADQEDCLIHAIQNDADLRGSLKALAFGGLLSSARVRDGLVRECLRYAVVDQVFTFDVEFDEDRFGNKVLWNDQVIVNIDGSPFAYQPADPSRFLDHAPERDLAWERENDRHPDVC